MADQVKVHGASLSPFNYRVTCTLKLKGIAFEFIEEDLSNKSALLLKYNPVHKKIPVLVHGENPVCESMIILEYIEETWPQNPLMPSDPYERSLARFWIKFADDKGAAVWKIFRSSGQELEDAKKETLEMLQTVEEHGLGEKKFFHGDKIGLVDIAFASIVYWLQIIEDVLGMKLLESKKLPGLHSWFENFKQVPGIQESLPNRDELLVLFKLRREKLAASA